MTRSFKLLNDKVDDLTAKSNNSSNSSEEDGDDGDSDNDGDDSGEDVEMVGNEVGEPVVE